MLQMATVVMRVVAKRAMLCIGAYFLGIGIAGAFQLVTAQEAALPDDPSRNRRGGPTRGPDIIFVAPPPNAGVVTSPLHLKIKFKAHGGAGIDRDSVVITYKKIPAIDVTQRLMPFFGGDGIDAAGAEISPGTHRFRIELKDTDGRVTTDYLVVNVGK